MLVTMTVVAVLIVILNAMVLASSGKVQIVDIVVLAVYVPTTIGLWLWRKWAVCLFITIGTVWLVRQIAETADLLQISAKANHPVTPFSLTLMLAGPIVNLASIGLMLWAIVRRWQYFSWQ